MIPKYVELGIGYYISESESDSDSDSHGSITESGKRFYEYHINLDDYDSTGSMHSADSVSHDITSNTSERSDVFDCSDKANVLECYNISDTDISTSYIHHPHPHPHPHPQQHLHQHPHI